jgi:hypothetical protein
LPTGTLLVSFSQKVTTSFYMNKITKTGRIKSDCLGFTIENRCLSKSVLARNLLILLAETLLPFRDCACTAFYVISESTRRSVH